MASIKWGVTTGIIAALVSVALGIIFDVATGYILLRAIVFLFVFFALGSGLNVLINNYFPELLYFDEEPESKITFDQPGSQINITLGGMGEYAVPEMYGNSGDSEELGNIEDLISGNFRIHTAPESNNIDDTSTFTHVYTPEHSSEGIDLRRENDYNVQSEGFSSGAMEFTSFQEPESPQSVSVEKSGFTPTFGDGSNDFEALPDLGSMATAFSSGFEAEEATAMPHLGDEAESSQMQYNKGNKAQPLKGDFNPKELAEGLRTVLKKDGM